MRKPILGWPNYKIAKKLNDPEYLDLGKLATVFIIFGVVSLITSAYFNSGLKERQDFSYIPSDSELQHKNNNIFENIVGPLKVSNGWEVHNISITATLPFQSWSYIECEVLDADQEYLFSFGEELWYESGYDSDGKWIENKNNYDMKTTFPKKGIYYLNFKSESNEKPLRIFVKSYRKNGSSVPHFWFGIFTLLVGIGLNEIKNKTIIKIVEALDV